MSDAEVTGLMGCNVYVPDLEAALRFYCGTLGLEISGEMGADARFLRVGDNRWGIFVEGGHEPAAVSERAARASFTLRCRSASALHARIREAGTGLVHDAPQDMGNGTWWFQFRDPAGNVLEAIGGR